MTKPKKSKVPTKAASKLMKKIANLAVAPGPLTAAVEAARAETSAEAREQLVSSALGVARAGETSKFLEQVAANKAGNALLDVPPSPELLPGAKMLEEALARISRLEDFLRECLKTASFNSTKAHELLNGR